MTSTEPEFPTSQNGSPVSADNAGATELTPARRAWVENLTIVMRHKWLILIVTAIVTIATGIYAFTQMPNYYKAKAVILPARKAGGVLDNISSGIASSLKDIGLSKLHGGGEEGYSPLTLLTSREVMEKLIRQFDFIHVYKDSTMAEALENFSQNLDGELGEEGNFIISFEDTDPKRAAAVANAAIIGINEVNSRMAKEEAVHNLTYAEERYKENVADLDTAETALVVFQRKYGVFSLPDQAKAEVTAIAELEQEKVIAQIQLRNAEQMFGANASEVATYKSTIEQITSKLGEMQAGLDSKVNSFVPTNIMPDVAIQYLRLMREVEIQSKLKAFLLPSYEQSKLDENRNLYGFVTLDSAVAPIHKSRPKRSVILLGALVGTSALMSILTILLVNLRKARLRFAADRERLS